MGKKYRKRKADPFDLAQGRELPTEHPAGIYYRQSTLMQVGNTSTDRQRIDLKAYALKLGWREEDIILIDMDEGQSGRKGINERPGMRYMVVLIKAGKIKTVIVTNEARLFRDLVYIDSNIFIEICREKGVHILTASKHYDFNHPIDGPMHIEIFRQKLQEAANFLREHVYNTLLEGRHTRGRSGQRDGRQTIAGRMIDLRETLPDGSDNPDYLKFKNFWPYGDIVLQIFRRFIDLGFNMNALKREVDARADLQFPPLEAVKDQIPEGHKVHRLRYKISPVTGYHVPSRNGLENMLTNVNYIGHWEYAKEIVLYHNHEPLVPEDLFMQVYNRLSAEDFEGNPNPHYMPQRPYTRHKAEAAQTRQPTYKGLIRSNDIPEIPDKHVTTQWNKSTKKYNYQLSSGNTENRMWTMLCEPVDGVVDDMVRERLRQTVQDDALWQQVRDEVAQQADRSDIRRMQQTIRALQKRQENVNRSIDSLSNKKLIQEREQAYEALEGEIERLERQIAKREADAAVESQLLDVWGAVARIVAEWEQVSSADRRRLVELLADHIEMACPAWFKKQVILHWKDGTQSMREVANSGRGRSWDPELSEKLRQMMEANRPQVEILREFPEHKWRNLMDHYAARFNGGKWTKNYRGDKPYGQKYRWADTKEYQQEQASKLLSSSSHRTTTVTRQENQPAGPFDWYDLWHVREGLAVIAANLPGAAPDVLAAAD